MKHIAILLITAFCTPVWAGISITLNVPETLTPTTDSIVRNPVTLEATAFDADQLQPDSNTLELDEYQWLVGTWDTIVDNYNNVVELPFVFSLNGTAYSKVGISAYGAVTLLPSDYTYENFNSFQYLSNDWSNPNGGTFQLAGYPTVFPLARNSVYHVDWNIGQFVFNDVNENKTDLNLVKRLENEVIIYNRHQLQRYDSEGTKTSYPLEQVIILKRNGDIDLHFDTTFPFEELMVDTNIYEDTHSGLGIRFYSGIMIPRRVVNEETLSPLPITNNIITNGAKSFSFSAESLNTLSAQDLPVDGSNLDAAAPTLMADVELTTSGIDFATILTTGTETLTLPTNLSTGQAYNWTVRQLAVYTEGTGDNAYVSNWVSAWSEVNSFSVEAEEDDDDLFGFINPLLLMLLSPLLFFRKEK